MRAPDLTGRGGASASTSDANDNSQQNFTGRYTVVFHPGKTAAGIALLKSLALKVSQTDGTTMSEDQAGDVNALVYSSVEAATVVGEPNQIAELERQASDPNSPIMLVKPEKVRSVLGYGHADATEVTVDTSVTISKAYLEGCRDTFARLIEAETNGKSAKHVAAAQDNNGFDESVFTWGLQATQVADSPFSGSGIKVAVLDTGIDFTEDANGKREYHPDFAGRKISTHSFVSGVASAKDDNGHGTHCIGTACGPRRPATLPGYGVAFDAEIFAGKVLNDEGKGADGWILAGIDWAINQRCRVISMSLGAPKNPGDPFNEMYEAVAQRALQHGAVIVAAGGNDSARPSLVSPVSGPADCPSIMAVAAVEPNFQVARFSNGGLPAIGREINIAAPGVGVFSSFLRPPGHRRLQGTSMATPHVAGIAALCAEAEPSLSGQQLWDRVVGNASKLPLSPVDVGSGLAQAPLSSLARVRSRAADVSIEQTSPITVGGGGSVGLDFDRTHYVGSAGLYISQQDKLADCLITRQDGKQLRNFFPEIDGNQCLIVIVCTTDDAGNNPSEIRVAGAPTGRLAIAFTEGAGHFSFDNGRGLFYDAGRKVFSVTVQNILTGAATPFELPTDFRGVVKVDN